MFKYDMEHNVPRFILNDKNGYAIAKAIAAGLQMMNDIIEQGVQTLIDPSKMPEWRLDEMAWETNCLYDYSAPIESKRLWITNALPLYRLHGTPAAIKEYLGNYFEDVVVEEYWDYDGEPYHFRITVDGDWDSTNEAWAIKAIEKAKNARSIFDSIRMGDTTHLAIMADGDTVVEIPYPLTGTISSGEWP